MDVSYLLLFTILPIFLYVLYHWAMRKQKYWEKLGIPTVHSAVPYFGNIWPVMMQRKSFGELYRDIYKSFPSCSMIGLYNSGEIELMINDPELIKTVLQTNFTNFDDNGISADPDLDPLMKRNAFGNTGEEWKNNRAVLSNTMTTSKIKNMAETMHEVSVKFSKYINENVEEHGTLEVEAQSLFVRFTAGVVAGVGFGVDGHCFEKDTGTFVAIGSEIFRPSGLNALKQFIVFLIPKAASLLQARFLPKEFDTYCRRIVSDILKFRKGKGLRGNDFIQHVCDMHKSEDGKIDEDFVTCHAATFYIEGYLSSSYTLSLISYDIARNPEIQNKLRSEIKAIIEKHHGELTYDTIQDMKYLNLVMKESMRMSSVISVLQKKCTKEFKLTGSDGLQYNVKPGTKIIISPLGLHTDPKYWTDPEVFRPERFDDENKNDFPQFVYLPFGAGPRTCVGMRMAMLQMKYALVTLLNNYSITLSPKTKIPITFDPANLLNAPVGGLWLNIKRFQ